MDLPKVKGSINPNVTQANIDQTICKSGWTSTIRPSAYYTTKLKIQQMDQLGLTGSKADYEEDHLISLELGGNPTDPNNLWPEHWAKPWGARDKDRLEDALKDDVCSHRIILKKAQSLISKNWIKAYIDRFGDIYHQHM